MIENAGIDSTEAFEDVGHSSDAREMLEQYYKGASHHCLVTKQCLVSGVAALSLQGNCMKRTGRGPQTGEPRPGAGRGRPVRRRKGEQHQARGSLPQYCGLVPVVSTSVQLLVLLVGTDGPGAGGLHGLPLPLPQGGQVRVQEPRHQIV